MDPSPPGSLTPDDPGQTAAAEDSPPCLAAALEYAERGWPVFPLQPHGKAPLLAGHGHRDASTDEAVIRSWYAASPDANVGIACEPAGLVVLDIDDYKAECEAERWLNGRELPPTYTVSTGNGGRHYYYLAPEGAPLPSSNSKLAKCVDVKARGAYVGAPPSKTTLAYEVIDPRDPVPSPVWLADELRPGPDCTETEPRAASPTIECPAQSAYARKVMDEEGARLAAAPEGTRNDTLNRVGFRFGQLVATGHVSRPLAEKWLRQSAARASSNGNHPLTKSEIDNAVTLSVNAGMNDPGNTPKVEDKRSSERVPRDLRSPQATPALKSTPFSKVAARTPELLWDQRLVSGGITLVGGNGGVGKSSLVTSIAAAFANGKGLPGQSERDRGSTLMLSYEDPPEVLAHRLEAGGFCADRAPYGSIEFIDAASPFEDSHRQLEPDDIELVCERARSIDGLRLVVLDPVMQFIGPSTNPMLDNQIRAVLSTLRYLADELNVAVLVVAHTRKGMPDGYESLAEWIAGSSGIKNYSRSALVALKEPRTGRRFVVHAKANWSAQRPDLEYTIESGLFRWSPTPAPDLVRNLLSVPRLTELDRACEFLTEMLKEAGGSLLKEVAVAEADKQGIRPVTLDRARTTLHIASDRTNECPSRAIWTLHE